LTVIILRPESHPLACGTCELDDLRAFVSARQTRLQPRSFAGVGKGANLNRPASAGRKRFWRLQYFQLHAGGAGPPYINLLRRGQRQIDDAITYERSAVVDTHDY